MSTFIEKLCDDILSKYKKSISGLCIVFPSRRAGLFFKSVLGKKLDAPVWSPDVYSIEDFVEEYSGLRIADNLFLLFGLFDVYTKVIENEKVRLDEGYGFIGISEENESFDSFYPWGEILLKDFDVIDKYAVDAGLLFKRINDLKEIEENFPIELQDVFKKFWGTLFENRETFVKENFVKIWQVLGEVYVKFREKLTGQNTCYPGMAYRKLFEDIKSGEFKIDKSKIIFAGFNSLSTAERVIMESLMNKGIAEIYWDADEYYFADKNQEAGSFLRKNAKYFGQENLRFEKNLEESVKKINAIGASSSLGMAKTAGSELKKLTGAEGFKEEETAIILLEEKLLMPVLYSIPDEVKNLNVTMGMPFSETPVYGLINLLLELQSNCIFEKGKYKFYFSDVEKVIMHQYVKFNEPGNIFGILNFIKEKNKVYFGIEEYNGKIPGILNLIFKKVSVAAEYENYLDNIITYISQKIESDDSKDTEYKKFRMEYFFTFYSNFTRFNDILRNQIAGIKTETYKRFLREVFSKASIPFTGEPLRGLQVMGLLETRNIDFKNVFILSANEGVLPKGKTQNSFIPYSLRKAMRMPTYEEEDSTSAYYFYRLMQRAENIYLIYNTDISKEVKEKSRFILQVENELLRKNPKIIYNKKISVAGNSKAGRNEIEIKKDENVMRKLIELNHLSPSSLIKYINCSLQFYFEKIAELKQQEEVEETFSAMLIGNVLHKILEDAYKQYIGKFVDLNILETISGNIENNFNEILEGAVRHCDSEYVLNEFGGRNYLFAEIILHLLKRVFENEKTQVPFKIVDLEKEIKEEFEFGEIKKEIKGRIDRIDEKDGITRIIDYKTGSYELKKFKEDYFDKLISEPAYKENFQAFLYGYFYSRENPGKEINVGIYPVKKLRNGIDSLKDGYIEEVHFKEFEERLKILMSEIFDKEIPFRQAEDEDRCKYCPYAGICYRDLKNTI